VAATEIAPEAELQETQMKLELPTKDGKTAVQKVVGNLAKCRRISENAAF